MLFLGRTETVKTDKRNSSFSLRIPDILSEYLSELTTDEKVKLNNDLILCMAHHVHNSSRVKNLSIYLVSHDDSEVSTFTLSNSKKEKAFFTPKPEDDVKF